MNRIGRDLLNSNKAAANVEKSTTGHRDLLSLLVQANIAVNLPDNQRLSDADVLARTYVYIVMSRIFWHTTHSVTTEISTFIVAGTPIPCLCLADNIFISLIYQAMRPRAQLPHGRYSLSHKALTFNTDFARNFCKFRQKVLQWRI